MNVRDIKARIEQKILRPKNLNDRIEGAAYMAPVAALGHMAYVTMGTPVAELAGYSIDYNRSLTASAIGSGVAYGSARILYTDKIPMPIAVGAAWLMYAEHIQLGCAAVTPTALAAAECVAETVASYAPAFILGATLTAGLLAYNFFGKSKIADAKPVAVANVANNVASPSSHSHSN